MGGLRKQPLFGSVSRRGTGELSLISPSCGRENRARE